MYRKTIIGRIAIPVASFVVAIGLPSHHGSVVFGVLCCKEGRTDPGGRPAPSAFISALAFRCFLKAPRRSVGCIALVYPLGVAFAANIF
jgi:hypothetical protein